jgi:hypothetical protein
MVKADDTTAHEKICDLADTRLNEPNKTAISLRPYNGNECRADRITYDFPSTSNIDKILA